MESEQNILLQLNDHANAIKSMTECIKKIEEKQSEMDELIKSVNELAFNMKHMIEEQIKQGNKLEKLEQAPLESMKLYKRQLFNAIISALAGLLVGALFTAAIQAIK